MCATCAFPRPNAHICQHPDGNVRNLQTFVSTDVNALRGLRTTMSGLLDNPLSQLYFGMAD